MKKIIPASLALMALFAVSGCTSSSPETSSEKSSTQTTTPVMTPAALTEQISRTISQLVVTDADRQDAEDTLKLIRQGDEMCEQGTLNGKPITRELRVDTCIKLPGMKYATLELIKNYS